MDSNDNLVDVLLLVADAACGGIAGMYAGLLEKPVNGFGNVLELV